MRKPVDVRKLAVDILDRSTCGVQVGAAIEKSGYILSWGWNSTGFDGFGLHAESHAIMRANKKRLHGATIYVASLRSRNGKMVTSKPCANCQQLIDKWNLRVVWRENTGEWIYGL